MNRAFCEQDGDRIDELCRALERLEWSRERLDGSGYPYYVCPRCGNRPSQGHIDDVCFVGRALRRTPGKPHVGQIYR